MINKIKVTSLLCITIIIVLCISQSFALQVEPLSDSVFDIVTTTLKTTKAAKFDCTTYGIKNSISVTYCWLEKKATNGTWFYVCSLPHPSLVEYNTFSYTEIVDYSPYIGTGTYRIWATYNADGHTVTRCSNERTY